jgi:threonine/homoserine/homoserine lactone efflux protein
VIEILASAAVLGLAGGFGPGPLQTLVVSETLAHGLGAGVRVALAPILTDAPIVIVSLLLIARLSSNGLVLGSISIAGGGVVMAIGLQELWRGARRGAGESKRAPRSLQRGVVVNLLNPHPYVFWFGVGSPLVVRAYGIHLSVAIGFVAVLYTCLVGSKVIVAWIAARSRNLLRGRAFDTAIRVLGVLMVLFALLLIRDGIDLIRSPGV